MKSTQQQIVTTRLLSASRDQVFAAYRDPRQLARWWGPNGFTNTFHEFDFRPGGYWRFDMHGPDGATYPNENRFDVISEPEHVAIEHLSSHPFQIDVVLQGEAGKTRMTWRMVFASAEDFRKLQDFVMDAKEQNFDRLEAMLRSAG